ncbi:P-loop containing nucleoside triphosphate hydrolase protein [Phascolomyces articulosus]|uniref:P-loop containing nucleoside triphosphate hydrolase protein n=1 Tax=Phascolomyces articulosus TaxID=60185 RepID=A0AAD5KE89_9FUNG|nr:P-loop containing nucleoside triphosphate hydrolase protein [Phascolomyces articulosus]
MPPLEVIGAGFGRTGTDSLRAALNILGYNTHHMFVMLKHEQEQYPELFTEAYEHPEHDIDWDKVYTGFNAAVDWPTSSFIKQLLEKYPKAKVLLTRRDPDDWYRSVKNTIFHYAQQTDIFPDADDPNSYYQRLRKMAHTIIMDGAFGNPEQFLDEEATKAKFVAHNKWVEEYVPADQLLVMELGEGWERLCQFLNKPVPDVPYPRSNSTAEIQKFSENFHKVFENGSQQATK